MKTNGWTDEHIANFLATEYDKKKLTMRAHSLRCLNYFPPTEWHAFVTAIHRMLERNGPPLPELEPSRAMIKAGLISYTDPMNINADPEDVVMEIFKEMWEARPKEYK